MRLDWPKSWGVRMNKTEAEAIVRRLAVLDNRRIDVTVIDTWHELIGHISYAVGERALLKAMQDAGISWVEPKHVLAKAREARMELDLEAKRVEVEEPGKSDPQPICAAHNLPILKCDDCCARMAAQSEKMAGSDFFAWADNNIFGGNNLVG